MACSLAAGKKPGYSVRTTASVEVCPPTASATSRRRQNRLGWRHFIAALTAHAVFGPSPCHAGTIVFINMNKK
jgi:hypothetical protein